jgi:hypothetical protein
MDLISNRARHKRFNEPNANASAARSSSSLCLCGESSLRLIRLGYQRSPRQGSFVAVDIPTNSKSARVPLCATGSESSRKPCLRIRDSHSEEHCFPEDGQAVAHREAHRVAHRDSGPLAALRKNPSRRAFFGPFCYTTRTPNWCPR